MKRTRRTIMLFCTTLAWAGSARAADPVVLFNGGPPMTFTPLRDRVTVYGDDAQPRFATTRAFLEQLAAPGTLRLWAWDQANKRVRVSAEGPGLWLSCADLATMPLVCATRLHIENMNIIVDGLTPRRGRSGAGLPPAAGLPMCPGDPRCPQRP